MGGKLVLYAVPASHPCAAVEAALRRKALAYERVDLLPVLHVAAQLARFGRRTVPGLILSGGERVVGSRAIMRVLDGLEPEPPLLPAGAALRARVEAAEEWGDAVLQPVARRLIWPALQRRPDALASYAAGARLPLPPELAARSAPVVTRAARALHRASDRRARADLAALPGHLDRIDAWIAEGVLGGAAVTAADLQIGATVRLLLTMEDLTALIEPRPAGALARRLFPEYPGRLPAGALQGA